MAYHLICKTLQDCQHRDNIISMVVSIRSGSSVTILTGILAANDKSKLCLTDSLRILSGLFMSFGK